MDRNRNKDRRKINVQMLKEIMQLNFAIVETELYLNTHPGDQAVLNLHNEFARRYVNMVEEYQEDYGAIYPNYPNADYPWQYINEPWPWQIEY